MQESLHPLPFIDCISVSSSTLSSTVFTTVVSLFKLVAIFSTDSRVIFILHFNFRYAICGRHLGRSME